MSEIVIKTEKVEEEDIKPQIKEGGGIVANSGSGGGGAATAGSVGGASSGGASASLGPKAIVEKTQAALKVANEAKQLNLRLKEQYLLQQPLKPQQQQQPALNQSVKRTSNTAAEQLQADDNNDLPPYKVGNKRFRVQAPRSNSAATELLDDDDNNDHTQLPHYKVGNKRFRVHTPARYVDQKLNNPPATPLMQHSRQQRPTPAAMGTSKCGEIFVTNNARKWTFVCTYCQKTTRDIGEFVCHIKYKHMPEQYREDDEDNEDYENEENIPDIYNNHNPDDSYNNHDQDLIPSIKQVSSLALNYNKTTLNVNSTSNLEYFDCTNYLDVNVHTESDEMPPNNGVKSKANLKTPQRPSNNTKEPVPRQIQKNKFVVDLLDDDDDQDNGKKTNDEVRNELFDYEMEDDEDGVELVEDDNDEMMEGMDDDNLLFLRSSSIDETVGGDGGGVSGSGEGKSGIKKYRSHVRGKAYCNLCDKTFQYYSLYRNHMIKHSNITPYKCQYCSKAFKSKQAIRYHMNTHTKEVQYNCPLCPMIYGTENQFITHVLNHESDTCFPCMVCAKILKSDQERDEHLSTHTEERPYGCNYCNKRFRQKHHLSNHLKLHCQYRCDFCKEEFTSTQTQRRPYACPSCEEYPEIRIQVEKQRSKSLNNSEVNPLDITYEGGTEATECVDLATDEEDDESETSTSILAGGNNSGGGGGGGGGQKRIACQYCPRSYKQNSALNYHMRQKHPQVWAELK